MGRRREMHRKPNKQELNKMERIKSLLEGEGSKENIVTVQPVNMVQRKVEIIAQRPMQDNTPYIKWGEISAPLRDIRVNQHCIKRAIERINVKDKADAISTLKNLLKQAKCIGLVTDENNNDAILYAKGRTGLYLSTDLSEIKTVIRHEKVSYEPIKSKIYRIHETEFRKLERLEKSKTRKLEELKLLTDIEIAELNYKIHKTRSTAVRNSSISRINAIHETIKQYEDEIEFVKSSKRQLTKSMVAIL